MAVNPLISLQAQAPDAGAAFSNTLLNLNRLNTFRSNRAEQPARNRILEAQAQTTEAAVPTEQAQFNQRERERILSLAVGAQQIIPDLQAGRTEQVIATLLQRKQSLAEQSLPTNDTDEAIELVKQGNLGELLTESQHAVQIAKQIAPQKADGQKQVNVLRKDVFNLSKSFRVIDEAQKRIESVGDKATAASDIALIFNFMKINDPGSTVREGEFATAQNAAGVPARILNAYNNALSGTRLTPDQRQDFLTQARNLAGAQRKATDEQIENVLQQADVDEIPRSKILGETRLQEFEQRTGAGQQPGLQEGATATNPATGQRIILKNGQWQPAP